MSFAMETSEDIGGGASDLYLQQPGTYHCVITDVSEGRGPKGNPINGFMAELTVLDGTTEGQKDKQTNLVLFSPDLSKSQANQDWARKKQTAFVVASGLLDLAKLGRKVDIELDDCKGRQIIIQFDSDEYDGKSRLQLAYANIWHVDDPRAAKFPKDKGSLDIIPKSLRKPAEYFEPLMQRKAAKPQESRLNQDELAGL